MRSAKVRQNAKKTICIFLVWPFTIQFWHVSGEKKMPSTPVYDKDGLEKCSGTNPKEILVRNRLFQTSPNWRENLPRLEGALFQGLGAWRIIFFYIRNHFLKIHAQGIPKMSDFYVFSHFWPRKWLLKLKKRVLTPSFSHLTFSSQMGTLSRCRPPPIRSAFHHHHQ